MTGDSLRWYYPAMSERDLSDIGPQVENYNIWGHFEAMVTVGEDEPSRVTIPALDLDQIPHDRIKKLPDEYFERTHSPFICFRIGDRGVYYAQANPQVLSIKNMTYTRGKYFDLINGYQLETKHEITGPERYKRLLLDGRGNSIEISRTLNDTGQPYKVRVFYVPPKLD